MVSLDSQQEAHIDTLLESSEGIVVIMDGNGRIQRLSKGARQTLGYADNEVTGNNILMIVPSDRRDWMSAISKRGREDRVIQDIFMHWRTKDGRRLITRSTLKAVVNYQGQVVGMIIAEKFGETRDRSEDLMTPEQAMNLLRSSEIANIVTDLSGNVLLFNSGAETLLGFASSQLVGTNISRLFLNREVLGGITARALRDGKVEDSETTLVSSREERKQVSVSLSVIRNPSGAATRLSFILVDITKRKEMERELELRAEKLRLVNELAKRIRSGRSLSEIYAGANEDLSRIMEYDEMTLMVTSQDEEKLKITSLVGNHPDWLSEGELISMDSGPFAHAVKDNKPVIYTPSEIEHLSSADSRGEEDFRTAVILPLFAGERCLGLLNFTSSQHEAFGPRELSVLMPVADHMALAIETSRLVTALMENINIQTGLMETGATLRSLMDLNEIYETAVARARELISSDLCILFTSEDDALRMVAVAGADRAKLPSAIGQEENSLLSAFFFSSGEPLIREVQKSEQASEWERDLLGSVLIAKLVGMKGSMGVILLSRNIGKKPFSFYELEMLNLYVNHLSPSIENAMLFEETKDKELNAQVALDSERRTREALNFLMDTFAHDTQNQIQGILGYLDLISQLDIPEMAHSYVDKAVRQLRAGSFLVAGAASISKNIDSERIHRSSEEISLALSDAIRRFSEVYTNIEVKLDLLTETEKDRSEAVDSLLSGLFSHVMRLMAKALKYRRIDIEFSRNEGSDKTVAVFRIRSSSTALKLLKGIDGGTGLRDDNIRLLSPFVVRLLGEIYGAKIQTKADDRDAEDGIDLRCTLEFRE